MSDNIPYESEERLQDPQQQHDISQILGLEVESLTNTKLQPVPLGVGAGRVKQFRENVGDNVQSGGTADVEMCSATAQSSVQNGNLRGYPSLASFIGSDRDFFIFRRFNALSARNLLYLQDELVELEDKLRTVDLADLQSENQRGLWNLHSRREDKNIERRYLMMQLNEKLKSYQDALYSQSRILALEDAPGIYVDSVANWIDGTKPVTEAESHFLDIRGDIVSLAGRESSKELLEKYLEKNWYQYFIPKGHKMKSQTFPNSSVEFYSTASIKRAARLIMTFLAVLSLVVPLLVLQFCRSPNVKLVFVVIFSFGFAAMMSVLTTSRTYEIAAAMAAYAAFLSFFIGNSS